MPLGNHYHIGNRLIEEAAGFGGLGLSAPAGGHTGAWRSSLVALAEWLLEEVERQLPIVLFHSSPHVFAAAWAAFALLVEETEPENVAERGGGEIIAIMEHDSVGFDEMEV